MKKRIKKMMALLTAVLVMAMLAVPASAETNTTNFTASSSEARNGVVRVLVTLDADIYDYDSGDYAGSVTTWASGTGFGVGTAGKETDIFITNRHVVTVDDLEDGVEKISGSYYYIDYTITGYYILLDNYAYNTESDTLDTSRAVPCTIIYKGSDDDTNTRDIAVLQAAEDVSGRIALALQADEGSLDVGDSVTALGYPGLSDNLTSDGYMLATVDDVTLTSGVVSRFYESTSVTSDSSGILGRVIQHDATINSGNSGGPLIDGNGTVVGINTYTAASGDSTSVSLRIQYAKEALDSLGIDYDVYPGASISTTMIIIIAVAAAAVILIIVLVVVSSKKKKKEAPADTPKTAPGPAASPVSAGEPASSAAPPVTPPVTPPATPADNGAAPQQPKPNDSGYRLQGVSGPLEGRRFMIRTDSPLTLGRNPENCNVAFPADTPGVSGKHCQVWFDHGTVYIRDLGSSHGTYLLSGTKLSAEQPIQIKPGDSFYLGSSKVTMALAQKGGR